ncbi:MAG: monovalent cation/H(+) antiporter subunit G [Clostridiaceae bacterium]|nr:monovalent cation/H(+) antiporter subunit G [Clostridiaceae bacterium]
MIWEWIRFSVAAVFIISGLVFELLAVFGVYRLKYVLNRMHAAAMGDTLGISLVLIGLIVIRGLSFDSLKFILIIFFLWLASPVASHLIARLETTMNPGSRNYKIEKR